MERSTFGSWEAIQSDLSLRASGRSPGPVCFVTPHAARRYRQLIFSRLTEAQAVLEIQEGLLEPLFQAPAASGDATFLACLNRKGHPFVAACDPAPEAAEFLLVRTVGPWWY
jgi:hypothetical protein